MTCPTCKRPVWDGGHALNERECDDEGGEVCRLHAEILTMRCPLDEDDRAALLALWNACGDKDTAIRVGSVLVRLGVLEGD